MVQISTLTPVEDLVSEQEEMPRRNLQLMEHLHWSGLPVGIVACGEEPVQKQVFWQEL